MKRASLVILIALSWSAPAPAQRARPEAPEKPKVSVPLRAPKAVAAPCAEYGPGFVRIEGSSTCIKIGGSFGVGVGASR
jgi:hypothetical protein